MRRIGLVLVSGLVLGAAAGFGQTSGRVEARESLRSLDAEYQLARQSSSYFVLDVLEKRMELRIKGMPLKTWAIDKVKFWGRPDFNATVELARKSALRPPRRNVITPGEPESQVEESGKFELEALELEDMPQTFSLYFDTGLHIAVRSGTRGFKGLGRGVGEAVGWYVWLPIRNLFRTMARRPVSELEFTFADGRDAQAVYWIFYDGIKGIIRR